MDMGCVDALGTASWADAQNPKRGLCGGGAAKQGHIRRTILDSPVGAGLTGRNVQRTQTLH